MARALMVTSSFLPGRGGIESYLAQLCEMRSPEFAVLAPPSRDGKALPRDLSYTTLPLTRRVPVPAEVTLRDVLSATDRLGVDRVIFGTPWPLALMAPSLREKGIRCAAIVHGAELIAPSVVPLLRGRLARALTSCDLLLPVSGYTGRKAAAFLEQRGHPVPAMPLLRARVDLERFHCVDDKATVRQRAGLPQSAKLILTFGRLVPRKGTDRLIKAMPRIRRQVPDARLVVAGTGPEERKLRKLAASFAEDTMFLGRVPERSAPDVYGSADVFALAVADRWFGLEIEGLGVVLLEAGACCVPSVTGKSGGTPEAVLNGTTGSVVDGKSISALADAIAALLMDEASRARMGAAARRHVEEHFSGDGLPAELSEWLGIRS